MVKILDGGLASQLATFVPDVDTDPLWSARLLKTNPNAIINVHNSYFQAGANVAITASYQASIEGFGKYLDLNESEALELMKLSVTLAKKAKEEVQNKNKDCANLEISGSIGPHGACLHDGSEYHGNYVDNLTIDELMKWHRPRMNALVESGVDYLALETIPAQKEGEALVTLLKEFPHQKAWLSFACKDSIHTNHGEVLHTAISSCLSINPNQLIAVGVNCTHPDNVQPLLKSLSANNIQLPFVVYPNSGEEWVSGKGWNGKEKTAKLSSYVSSWLNEGARYIGGCCRSTPQDIAEVKQQVQLWSDQN